ncbi:MAG: MBOAT family O-acyltransferase, partial [Fibrobacteraceae bacterium]|nr:MBOAT family O-acyltransferase [Fibrobacteraceae bacterium]
MFFHSWLFILFGIAVVGLFYCLPKGLPRRLLLLLAGLYFYACFRPEYLILMLAVVFVDYTMARLMQSSETEKFRKLCLAFSLFFDLGILFLFKYLGFFEETWNAIFSSISGKIHLPSLLLPMGISFYTFQSLSYVIDVYRKKISAEKSFLQYSLYVTFFPQLVAGPIENAKHLLPQVRFEEKSFAIENFREGTFRILQGFFKKAILADTLATIADPVFLNPQNASSLMILVSAVAFAFQIYFDFSGYSD